MPEVLATWDQFDGGHWGNEGPFTAEPNQWGGANMTLMGDGSLVPVTSSRWLQLNANPTGKIWGMFWGWGANGDVYYIHARAAATGTFTIYRFTPNPASLPNTLTTISTFTSVISTEPDWVSNKSSIYFTVYGDRSYEIRTLVPDLLQIGNGLGQSPGGRCIAIYKDRIFVGNISDARFGNHANRIHFSGWDSTNDTADGGAWESGNYFDVGGVRNNSSTPTLAITGLFPMRDYMVIVCDDQQMFILSGTPNVDLTLRRAYGFQKGSGGLTAFLPTHGTVDPSQTRTWLFDHTSRAPIRFNGASITRLDQFGVPHRDRTGTDLTEGAIVNLSGPDEFLCNGVAVSRAAGQETASHSLLLLRINGVYTLVTNDVLAARA